MKTEKPSMQIETITLKRAKELLDSVKKEREVSIQHVAELVQAQRDGAWDNLNGDTICIDAKGKMWDGQHRCLMVIKTGMPIITFVAYNIDQKTMYSKDQAIKKRTICELLQMAGEKNASYLGAALRLLWRYDRKCLNSNLPENKGNNLQLFKTLKKHPKVRESLQITGEIHTEFKAIYGIGASVFFHYIFGAINKNKRDVFFKAFITGANLEDGHPVLVLRDRLFKQAIQRTYKLSPMMRLALTIKAWNAFLDERRIYKIHWGYGEKFPEIDTE